MQLEKKQSNQTGAGHALLIKQAAALLSGESDRIANAANLSALIFNSMEQVNWAGFYFLQGDELVLGPFQGQPACVRIPNGKGVCGTASETAQTQLVPDIDRFEGHIACDAASRSEVVVPLLMDGSVIGVLDIDSPIAARFSDQDQVMLEALADLYIQSISGRN